MLSGTSRVVTSVSASLSAARWSVRQYATVQQTCGAYQARIHQKAEQAGVARHTQEELRRGHACRNEPSHLLCQRASQGFGHRINAWGGHGINAAMALFHKRWTLRILWELREGPATFRVLQAACSELSSSVLNVRLADLREAGLVAHSTGEGYALTAWGESLLVAMRPLVKWSAEWHEAMEG